MTYLNIVLNNCDVNLFTLIVLLGITLSLCIEVFPDLVFSKTLDKLVSEMELVGRDVPHFDVGSVPSDIEFDFGRVYVTNSAGHPQNGTISVIDVESTKVTNIPVGGNPQSITLELNRGVLYVAAVNPPAIYVIDRDDYSTIKVISVDCCPKDITYNVFEDKLYVSSIFSDTLTVINGTDYRIMKEIPVKGDHTRISSDPEPGPDKNIIFVTTMAPDTLTVINGTDYSIIKEIPIRGDPRDFEFLGNGIYVVNTLDNRTGFLTIINGNDYSTIKEIPVGESPVDIEVLGKYVENKDQVGEPLYQPALLVANSDSGSVTVINGTDYSTVREIPVDESPVDIEVFDEHFENQSQILYNQSIIFVANSDSGSVTVINGTDYSAIREIPVGESPSIIASDFDSTIYVVNSFASTGTTGSVTAIYEKTKNVLAGVSFDAKPFHGGRIICNGSTVPTNQYFYIDFRTYCEAQPNSGFQFTTWQEDLGGNSSRTLSVSEVSESPWNRFLTALGLGPKDASANLMMTKFGNFTANFEKLPPPLPDEYLIPLYGIIASSIIGWSIPSIIGGIKTKRQERKLYSIHKKINQVWDDGRLDLNDVKLLEGLVGETEEAYARGKINNERYMNLKTDISVRI